MHQGIKSKGEFKGHQVKHKLDVKNFPSQQLTRSIMVMGGVFWRGESREVVRLIVTTQLEMEDVCILCNIIENFWWKKIIKTERGGFNNFFKFQIALAQSCENISIYLCKHPNIAIVKRSEIYDYNFICIMR